jgi:glycosyltransferase involved in cell wall biosynthesis
VVLVEALQCGLPLLATDCEFGPADVITEPSIGALVEPDDPDKLAEGLRQAAVRVSSADDIRVRRATAAGYRREEAVSTHVAVLQALVSRARTVA